MSATVTRPTWRRPAPDASATWSAKAAPATAPVQSKSHADADDLFTVGTGGGRSPDVEPGVHQLVLHDVEKRVGPNRFEPGKESTSYIWSFRLATDREAAEGVFLYFTGITAKSQKLLTALAAFGIPNASGFRRSALVGKSVQGLVEMSDRGYARLVKIFPAAK